MDNLFTSYKLFSILRTHGIAACGTARANRIGEHFKEEILKENNGKILQWGEIRSAVEQKDDGEPVLIFIWQDQTIVRGMTTAHDGEGYMLRNRRRPKDSSSMIKETKAVFDIPRSENMLAKDLKKIHSSKLALPVILPIDDYNHHIGGVDIADQLREDLSIAQITVRAWLVYLFWLIDSALINAFILWRTEAEQMVVGRKDEHQRSQRVFREAIIKHLLKDAIEPPISYDVVIRQHHEFVAPNSFRLPIKYHQIQYGMPRRRCYFCRIKTLRGEHTKEEEFRETTGCMVCEVPLCISCFPRYHGL